MEKNKTGKYLKYAIGEIVLVVIGILIALQINNWNENRKAYDKSKMYLSEILKDLEKDTTTINSSISYATEYLNKTKWSLNKITFSSHDVDSIWMSIGGFYSTLSLTDRTFQKIQNSGESNLVGFDSIYDRISHYYTNTQSFYSRFGQWDIKETVDKQDYLQELEERLEISNYRLKLMGRETSTEQFPTIQDSSEQIERLIEFVKSPRGRNHFKNNYVRHKRGITVYNNTKSEAIKLIEEIKKLLNE
jgi:hypothetical protein